MIVGGSYHKVDELERVRKMAEVLERKSIEGKSPRKPKIIIINTIS